MRRIELDYQRHRPDRPGRVLFALGCLTAAAASVFAWQQARSINALEDRLAAIERRQPSAQRSASRSADPVLARTLREARAIDTLLQRRWSELFEAIEAAGSADIAVLAIDPDAAQGRIRITAEARRHEAMLAYLQRLGQGAVLRDAVLIEHRVQRQLAERPVRFSLSATWEQAR